MICRHIIFVESSKIIMMWPREAFLVYMMYNGTEAIAVYIYIYIYAFTFYVTAANSPHTKINYRLW